jgi:hypothetical protein
MTLPLGDYPMCGYAVIKPIARQDAEGGTDAEGRGDYHRAGLTTAQNGRTGNNDLFGRLLQTRI